MKLRILLSIVLSTAISIAQELVPLNGVKPSKSEIIALTNVSVYVSPGKLIEKGTIVIQNEQIVKVGGPLMKIPDDALVLDYSGKVILPAFIECNSSVGMPKVEGRFSFFPQMESSKKGAYYWNESIHPEVNAADIFTIDEKAIEDFHKMGFGLYATRINDGIAQGNAAVLLATSSSYHKALIKSTGNAFFSFNKGVSNQSYPSSQMGSIALLRQSFYDALWYQNSVKKETNISLDYLSKQIKAGMWFYSTDRLEILRAMKIAKEFNVNFTYIGTGLEYEIVDKIRSSSLVIPLTFPEAYDVKDPYVSKEISLKELKIWEMAPKNPAILAKEEVRFALSGNGLSVASFWKNIKKAIQEGLSEEAALKALTLTPATFLGIENEFGSLEEGKNASFIVFSSNPFKDDATVLEAWMSGEQKVYQQKQLIDMRGTFSLVVDDQYFTLEISGALDKPTATIKNKVIPSHDEDVNSKKKKGNTKASATDSLRISCSVNISGNDISLQFYSEQTKWKGSSSFHGKYNAKFGIFEGDAALANGKWARWSAIKNGSTAENVVKNEQQNNSTTLNTKTWFPNMAYGFEQKPTQEIIVFKNVTIWTNEAEGIIEEGSVLVQNGKIVQVSKGELSAPKGAKVYDGKGMHLTSGIIDEHSHIAISKGVNEGGQAISAEVSIGDVVRNDDIEIYRQLSGGVTAAQLLHGSANPIGGQSALIKLKWGHTPDELLIPNAPKFIKFALGENVKQANWGEFNTIRFPQTRMGVEQIMYDAFERAKAYELYKKENPTTYRTDLELEVLLEILKKERFITCHSYIQSEINMLMHLADSMGFTLNTFTHILEGYKVADKMKAHGAGASTFADWWAYKYEVNEAIPQNAAFLTKMGIVTAVNSDDAEMGRRLNQEAAKAVKYGGLSEQEAWKLVTLNPAKLLHLDQRMGSVKVGKDADLVLWTTNPLSIEAQVVATIIDGEILFDRTKNQELEERNAIEKARIISLMLIENQQTGGGKPYIKSKTKHFHCNTFGEEGTDGANEH